MATPKDEEDRDRRILTLAAEVAEARDHNVPNLLLGLQDVLSEAQPGSKKMRQIKMEIWKYDLLHVLILVLKQDFDRVVSTWSTAGKLASLLSHCCVGIDPEESHEFYGLCLPEAAENILMLSRKIQAKYLQTPSSATEVKKELLDNFRSVLESLSNLFRGQTFLTVNALRSPWLLQLLLTDDTETALSTLNLMQNIMRVNPEVITSLDEKVINSILDEIVYKLSASDDINIGSSATRTVLFICDSKREVIDTLGSRYRGLRPLLGRWTGKGFGSDLKKLLSLLDAGTHKRVEMEQLHRAATTIQAMFRSFRTRKMMKKANHGIAKFQKSYRDRRVFMEQKRERQKEEAELKHQLLLARKRAMRDSRQKQMQILQLLPASEVGKHLQNEQDLSALKIQTLWRGYQERKQLDRRKRNIKRMRAAITIQRKVRKWLAKLESRKKEPPNWQRPPGLDDQRRVELQQEILEWRDSHQPKKMTREEQEDLHGKVQDMLRRHVMSCKVTRKKHQHREALLARLETDSDLLLNAPKLSDITPTELDLFNSKSLPVATKAKSNHREELRLVRQPWWKRLGDEYQDQQYEEDNALF